MVGDIEGLCCSSAISTAFISALGRKPVHLQNGMGFDEQTEPARGCGKHAAPFGTSVVHRIPSQSSSLAPYLCPLDKLLSSSPSIIPLSSPGIECRCLQGTPIGESEGPGPGKWAAIDGIEVERCLLFTLTPRQESHPWSRRRRQTD